MKNHNESKKYLPTKQKKYMAYLLKNAYKLKGGSLFLSLPPFSLYKYYSTINKPTNLVRN